MPEITDFEESNRVYTAPDCQDLPAWLGIIPDEPGQKEGRPYVVSCWTLSDEELQRLLYTKQIWLFVNAINPPPVALSIDHPFK